MKTEDKIMLLGLVVFMLMFFYSEESSAATFVTERFESPSSAPTQNSSNQSYSPPTQPNTTPVNTNIYTNPTYINPNLNNVNTLPSTVQNYPGTVNMAMPSATGANSLSSWGSTYASGNYGYSPSGNLTDYKIEPIDNTVNIPNPKIENPNTIAISADTAITTSQYPFDTTTASVNLPKSEHLSTETTPMSVVRNISRPTAYIQSRVEPIVIPPYKYSDETDLKTGIDKNFSEDKLDGYETSGKDFKPSGVITAGEFNNPQANSPYSTEKDN
ncbi:MAG: hypothetical protein NTZ63_05785 [Candidatus Omnitrophica bacterium]|nr:hypothetical protein [Candidatus Omnitrophota bacterium]